MGAFCSCNSKRRNTQPTQPSIPKGILLGIGNPLLDISSTVPPEFAEKQNLLLDTSEKAKSSQKYQDLVKNLKENHVVTYTAGGSVQNTFRAVQWNIGIPGVTTFMGAVGTDEYAEILQDILSEAGVTIVYQKLSEYSTGTCVALITGQARTLLSNLEASEKFTKDFLDNPLNYVHVTRAQYFYIEGYFLTVSPECILEVARHASQKNKTFMMNLSAHFVIKLFTDELLQYIDILFGNQSEAVKFAKSRGFTASTATDTVEIAKNIASLPKLNKFRQRIVIITQGFDPVVVAQGAKVQKFPVEKLPENLVKDTNGAGDAFVGGFLAQYIQGRTLDKCVECGIWTASIVIQQPGCTFPTRMVYPALLD